MFRRINLYSITKHYNISDNQKDDIENLVNYIEQRVDSHNSNKSRRFAEMWYDLLYNCSSVRRRASLDITSLMIHLEGMLYYLLNNSSGSSNKTQNFQSYINKIRTFLELSNDTTKYMDGYGPLDIRPGSNYAYFWIAAKVHDCIDKPPRNANYKTAYDIVGQLQYKLYLEGLSPAEYNMLECCSGYKWDRASKQQTNQPLKICYKSVDEIYYVYYGKNIGPFTLLINLLHKLYMATEDETTMKTLISYRNSVDHNGVIYSTTTSNATSRNYSAPIDNIVRYILLLASKICPPVTRQTNNKRSSRDITERLTDFFFSGTLLKKTTTSIDNVEKFSKVFGKKGMLITIIVAIVGLLGYYMYLNIDRRTIDFSNVPKTKRIELFDKIITGRETEEDMRHMQRDIRNFDSIKTYINDYEEH